jgi:hypothetical protein
MTGSFVVKIDSHFRFVPPGWFRRETNPHTGVRDDGCDGAMHASCVVVVA